MTIIDCINKLKPLHIVNIYIDHPGTSLKMYLFLTTFGLFMLLKGGWIVLQLCFKVGMKVSLISSIMMRTAPPWAIQLVSELIDSP